MSIKKKISISVISILAILSVVMCMTAFASQDLVVLTYSWSNGSASITTQVLSVGSTGKIQGQAKFNKGGAFSADSAESIVVLDQYLSSRPLSVNLLHEDGTNCSVSSDGTNCKATGKLYKKTKSSHHGIYGINYGTGGGFYIDGYSK